MKRILTIFAIILAAKITAFSSTILNPDSIPVATSDIKKANLIFVEHKRLLADNALLEEQVNDLYKVNKALCEIDSLRCVQIETLNTNYRNNIKKLNSEIKGKESTIRNLQVGCIVVSAGLMLALMMR